MEGALHSVLSADIPSLRPLARVREGGNLHGFFPWFSPVAKDGWRVTSQPHLPRTHPRTDTPPTIFQYPHLPIPSHTYKRFLPIPSHIFQYPIFQHLPTSPYPLLSHTPSFPRFPLTPPSGYLLLFPTVWVGLGGVVWFPVGEEGGTRRFRTLSSGPPHPPDHRCRTSTSRCRCSRGVHTRGWIVPHVLVHVTPEVVVAVVVVAKDQVRREILEGMMARKPTPTVFHENHTPRERDVTDHTCGWQAHRCLSRTKTRTGSDET